MYKPLVGLTPSSCLAAADVVGNFLSLGITCVNDYLPYLDKTNLCNNDNQFLTFNSTVAQCASKLKK